MNRISCAVVWQIVLATILTIPQFIIGEEEAFGAISGIVRDSASGTPLVGVNVILPGTRKGAVTDRLGQFEINKIPPGEHSLLLEYIGFATKRIANLMVTANQTTALDEIELVEQPVPLSEIIVSPGSYSLLGNEPSIRQTLTSEDIKIMGWGEDITRAIRHIPGIAGGDYSAKFNIRGGDTDEVLVLLDGMQIYNPFHQKDFGGGLFSSIDIESIEGVDLLTGGFSAEYGERMSGVLNMRTKSPKANERETSVGFSLMNARFFSMGSINGGKGSWLLSARRGYLDLVDALMGNEFKLKPKYYDALGKMEFNLGDKHSLALYGFLNDDTYQLNESVIEPGLTIPNIDSSETSYGNNYGWLTLKSFLSPEIFVRTIAYTGSIKQNRAWRQFDNDPQAHFSAALIRDNRDLKVYGLKQDWDYELADNFFMKFGIEAKRFDTNYDYFGHIDQEFITASDSLITRVRDFQATTAPGGDHLAAHLSGRFKLASPLTLELGVRHDHVSYTDDQLWSPRAGLVYAFGKATFMRAGWGYFYQSQSIDELNIQFGELAYHPAELAEHFVLGFEHTFASGLHMRAEGYYKRMSNLRDAYLSFNDIDEFYPEARDDLLRLTIDDANAAGLELYLKHDTGNKFSWWMSYILARAENSVIGIDYDGRLVKRLGVLPRPTDQRHTINIDSNYRLNKKWHFNFAWQFRTGWPETPFDVKRQERTDGTFAYYHDYGGYLSGRYPSYQRLDARINRHWYSSHGKISAFLHIINVYNHENIIKYDYDIINQNAETFTPQVSPETWFGIIPFAGVSWEF